MRASLATKGEETIEAGRKGMHMAFGGGLKDVRSQKDAILK